MTIVVLSGALANKPWNGGEAWVRLSYVLGLRRLGCDAHFVEQVAPDARTDRALAYFDAVTAAFELATATLLREDGEVLRGPPADELLTLAGEADLLLNISGNLTLEPFFSRFRRRAYLDLDPGYTQLWHSQGHDVGRLTEHHAHFTVGANIGSAGWPLPDGGLRWHPTLPPVLLDEWPNTEQPPEKLFTTVATWRGPYGRVEHDGRTYGVKLDEFRKVLPLPRRCGQTFELALDIHPEEVHDLEALREQGWRLVDPSAVAGDPGMFRDYVQGSGAEFSVAQGIYVESDSGWFSDRTTRYLASGKPALVQDTGFSSTLPTGEGLVTFRSLGEAAAGAERIAADYGLHSGAARAIAEEYFDSDKVIRRLLEDALA